MDIEVNVRINVTAKDGQREVTLIVAEQTTVGSFIRKVCKEHGIPMKSNYILSGEGSNEPYKWSSRLVNLNINSGASVVLSENENEEEMPEMRMMHCNLWWPFAFICFMVGLIGITAIVVVRHIQNKPDYEYGVVMDAGSSHTQLFVYKWNGQKMEDTAVASQVFTCRVKGPGISSYEENPEDLAINMTACLQQAAAAVPEEKHSSTPIYLGATAGMRLIHAVNSTVSDRILEVVKKTLAGSAFKFTDPKTQARIISGAEEGLYSWVTTNYLTGKFGEVSPSSLKSASQWNLEATDSQTLGAMDMGGASTQMTFNPAPEVTIPIDYAGDAVLYGTNYSVYTHSYLCYGINEIERKYKALLVKSQDFSSVIDNPCGPLGSSTIETYTDVFEAPCTKADKMFDLDNTDKNMTYKFVGSSNLTACMTTADRLFNFSADCNYSDCSFNGTYQAPVHGEFYAFSNFFYEMDFLNLTRNTSEVKLEDFTSRLNKLCSSPWSEVKYMKAVSPQYLPWYCFRGQYIHSLLTKGYHFNQTTFRNIRFLNTVKGGTEIGWSLGFMISASTSIPGLTKDILISQLAFILLSILFVIFLVLGIGFLCLGGKFQRQKQAGLYERLKTYGAV